MSQLSADGGAIFLSSVAPGRRESRVVLAAASGSLLVTVLLIPLAAKPVGEIWPFIPIYESTLAISDLITASGKPACQNM